MASAVALHYEFSILCYVGSVWDGELRLIAKTRALEDKPIFKSQLGPDPQIRKPSDSTKPPEIYGFDDDGKLAHLVAGLGNANSWEMLRTPEFRAAWPEGTKPEEENPKPEQTATFTWTDTNGDGRPQLGEVRIVKGQARGVAVMNDLSFLVTRFEDMTARFSPVSFDAKGAPSYDLAKPEKIAPAGGQPPLSGGNQALADASGWTVNTNAVAPFSPYGLGGTFRGEPRWSYPSAWPGLHASHEAAVPVAVQAEKRPGTRIKFPNYSARLLVE